MTSILSKQQRCLYYVIIMCIVTLIGSEDVYTFEDAERDGPSSGQMQGETEHLLRGTIKNNSLSTYSRP